MAEPRVPPQPPQTIISVPVQTPVAYERAAGALKVVTPDQTFVAGSYRPPVFNEPEPPSPPQTTNLEPVQTAV